MNAKLITKKQHQQMLNNGHAQRAAQLKDKYIDFKPVIKLSTPDEQYIWLLSELFPSNENIAFGLCDLGMGFPELGSVSISEIKAIRLPFGLSVERDRDFMATKTISEYAKDAYSAKRITA